MPSYVISPQFHTPTRVQPRRYREPAGEPSSSCQGVGGWSREQAGWPPEAGLGVHREGSSQRMAPSRTEPDLGQEDRSTAEPKGKLGVRPRKAESHSQGRGESEE